MFNFFRKKKPVIIAIHGFGVRRCDQLIPLKEYFINKGYEVECPELFDCRNENDTNADIWFKRASDVVEKHISNHREIILFGFSMGGVVASSLAAKYPTVKLILIAPAFTYMTINNVADAVSKLLDKEDNINYSGYAPLPSSFSTTFRTLVDTKKDDISKVTCPILIFHGTDDERIPYTSSKKIIKKISHPNRALILLNEGPHHLLENELNSKILLETANAFIENKL